MVKYIFMPYGSALGSNILKGGKSFVSSLTLRFGDGRSVSFWVYKWCGFFEYPFAKLVQNILPVGDDSYTSA